jgi:phosphoribosylanthranilate isomerase
MLVKICGITRREDALAAAQAGADFVGLVRAGSPRQVSLETARQIAANLPPATQPVLLFRDAELDELAGELAASGFKWVQLHGAEPVAYVRRLMDRFPGLHVIRAWEVSGADAAVPLSDYLRAALEEEVAIDVLLLDAPKRGLHPGYECLGEVARRCHGTVPGIWCAGGLTPGNCAAAVAAGRYAGVDVSRGVELSPGVKDQAAVRRFIDLARTL